MQEIIKINDNTYKENKKNGKTVKVVPVYSGTKSVQDVFSKIIINKISNKNDLDIEKNSNLAYNKAGQ